jgi:N-acylneuraminate cytidylyltransferase
MQLAVIPARGGSKRIPRKNIMEFCGKPIIAWSIEVALQSGCFDKVIVSTDDTEIADISRIFGAEVPFLRPPELADDHTGTSAVIRHAINWFEERGVTFDHVCCIYATAPFVTIEDIRSGLKKLFIHNADYAFTATSFPFPIQRAIRITASGTLEMFQPEHYNTRSQDLEEAYHDAGQFYWGKTSVWKKEAILFSERTVPIILPRYRVHDIDTMEDWIRAEMIFRVMKERIDEGNS